MADWPPKKNAAFTFAVSLVDRVAPHAYKASATLAAGDVKVDIDGAGFNNLTNLPAVTPAAGKRVEVDLTAAEMNGDVITVLFSDASGDQWNDLMVVLHTATRQIVDLAYLTAPLADVYAANTAAPTLQQAIMAIHQSLMAFEIVGTEIRVKKLDGTSAAFTVTTDHASSPTEAIRS